MLKVTKLTGDMACGKSHVLRLINDALAASGRPVIYASGESTPMGLRQAVKAKLKPVPTTGWRRLFSRSKPAAEGPVTILMDDCHDQFIKTLRREFSRDADVYLIVATYGS
jgi:hypothetical protein